MPLLLLCSRLRPALSARPVCAFLRQAPYHSTARVARTKPLSLFEVSSQPFSAPKPQKPSPPVTPNNQLPAETELQEFRKLGFSEEILAAVKALGLVEPSAIQRLAVPQALKGDDLAFSAATGSGKTLAYLLPIMQSLKWQEQCGKLRQAGRPRALVLVPTRELAAQVLDVTKQLSHIVKLSSCSLHGGEDWGLQKRKLEGLVDIVVASPGRLLQHYEKKHLYFSQVSHVVIDEMDTLLKDGFGPDLKKLLAPLEAKGKRDKVQYLMSTATLTPAVRKLMEDEGFPKTRFLQAEDAHKSLPTLKHVMLETKGGDKVQMLLDVLSQSKRVGESVIIFCNTVQSCRAVEHALKEVALPVLCYHGDMPSEDRSSSLERFRAGEQPFLVATDIAARGLDIPKVEHVVMFDFPLNPIEYLHRSGRTARAGSRGKVTSLLQKRDRVLASAIQAAVAKGLPLDALSARRKDYEAGGKLQSLKAPPGRTGARLAVKVKKGNKHSKYGAISRAGGKEDGQGPRQPGGKGTAAGKVLGRAAKATQNRSKPRPVKVKKIVWTKKRTQASR